MENAIIAWEMTTIIVGALLVLVGTYLVVENVDTKKTKTI